MTMGTSRPLLSNKLFWVGILYFAEGYPLGVFYEIFPVYFRQQGVELRQIGVLSLLGLAWTLKFLWAPAIDYWRQMRRYVPSDLDELLDKLALDRLFAAVGNDFCEIFYGQI